MTKSDIPCPKCEARAGETCRRVNGTGRVSTHKERLQAASASLGGTNPLPRRKSRVVKRFGAFLTMYGPKDAPTHAVLKLGHGPEPDTPRGFLLELESQEMTERHAKSHGLGTEWRLHFSGRPRVTPPKHPVRILNLVWQFGAARTPWLCAGRKQLTGPQAFQAGKALGQIAYECEHCGRHHLKGRRHG